MVTREEVCAAYRYLLGREPENDDVIAYHQSHPSAEGMRREIIKSEEFIAFCHGIGLDPARLASSDTDAFGPYQKVETEAEGPVRDAMWARIAESWRRLGEEVPHWSVLTQEEFLPGTIEENHGTFMETRATDMALIDAAFARLPNAAALEAGVCLEVGCGVGRVTRGLAERFGRVLAVDVSAPHLDIARQGMAAEGYTNVGFRRMERIDDYADLGAPQFFYSRIVLQHNPPPVQAAILRAILHGLAPSGAALFQIVTHIDGYEFSAEDYLKNSHVGMEMHVLPQRALFAILRETGVEAVEINPDESAVRDPRYRPHLVLARKP